MLTLKGEYPVAAIREMVLYCKRTKFPHLLSPIPPWRDKFKTPNSMRGCKII